MNYIPDEQDKLINEEIQHLEKIFDKYMSREDSCKLVFHLLNIVWIVKHTPEKQQADSEAGSEHAPIETWDKIG